jgi:FkbM family methyltransferase
VYIPGFSFARSVRDLRRIMSMSDAVKFTLRKSAPGTFSVFVRSVNRKLTLRGDTTDIFCFQKVLMHREYESPFSANPETKLIVDAGANTGFATNYYAATFPNARVVAIEPEAGNVKILKNNCEGLPNVTIYETALWPTSGRIELTDPGFGSWAYSVKDERSSVGIGSVETSTIDEILQQHGGHIDILKLDIEGAEFDLMKSNPSWLNRVDTIVVELHDRFRPGCAQMFYGALAGRPFNQEIRGENIFIDLRAH